MWSSQNKQWLFLLAATKSTHGLVKMFLSLLGKCSTIESPSPYQPSELCASLSSGKQLTKGGGVAGGAVLHVFNLSTPRQRQENL